MLAIVSKYLSNSNYSEVLVEFKDHFYSHPNYPSLFAITDSLSLLQIENAAVQLPKSQLEGLPENFMAKISLEASEEIVLVTKQENTVRYEAEDGKKHSVSLEEFRAMWSGLVIAIEKGEKTKTKASVHNKGLVFFGVVTGLVFLLSFFSTPFDATTLFFKLVSLVGLFASYFILQGKYEEGNPTISKICNFNTNTSCDSVIKSDEGETKWFGFADLPVLFFSISFLAISLDAVYIPFIGLISLLAIPVIVYSVYLQAKKLKKWCVLCLVVSGLLLLQAVYFGFTFSIASFQMDSLVKLVVISAIIGASWYFIKTIMEKNKTLLGNNNELSRFKRNFELFDFLTKETKEKERLEDLSPVVLGNKTAPIKLSLFLSPSCGHCHTAYKEGMDLVAKYPNKIKLQIFYNLNEANQDNPYIQIAKTVLQIGRFSSQGKEALDDWHIERMELEAWLKKWEQPEFDPSIDETLKAQYDWCKDNEFNFTPVKLINGRVLSNEYKVEELKYFLNDLAEENEVIKEQNEEVVL